MINASHIRFNALEAKLKRWLDAAKTGDESAYHEFLLALAPYLRGFFRKRMQSCPDQVEDLVQEVLLAIHAKKHTYDPQLPVSAWIHAIAKYKYVDFLRARHRDVGNQNLDDVSEMLSYSDSVSRESSIDIERLLDGLPSSFSIPLRLTKLDGFSIKEASEISGLSESAVKVGVHRGLKKLSKLLGIKYEH
jgi:RNA polymerase sigma-70 factor, ECF subfamily